MAAKRKAPAGGVGSNQYGPKGTSKQPQATRARVERFVPVPTEKPAGDPPAHTWAIDNRWSPGSSGVRMPDEKPIAAYSARWIDYGFKIEMVPDRQGLACDTPEAREQLIAALTAADPAQDLDAPSPRRYPGGLVVGMRRSGGYVYIDAWLDPDMEPDSEDPR